MAKINRWLLPEGVEEVLPKQAWQIEQFQRRVLDLYRSWGYEFVIPPLIEYSESLLIGTGSDMDVQSFKVTDQLSGRTLAIRADITPQTARIDAHSWAQEGPTRLCYAGTVLHTKPKSQLASRTPIEVGAELYGDGSIHSDFEVISLMLETLQLAGIGTIHLDLGNVAIYRELISAAGLTESEEALLFDAFDRKAKAEVTAITANLDDQALAGFIQALVELHGDISVLDKAKTVLAGAPASVLESIEELQTISGMIQQSFPDSPIYIDLSELRGYQYHTGLVFAAYIDGVGHTVANGGRYDNIGECFGRARPATGFSANVKALLPQMQTLQEPGLIAAPRLNDDDLQEAVAALRANGQRVVYVLPGNDLPANCVNELVKENATWQVTAKA